MTPTTKKRTARLGYLFTALGTAALVYGMVIVGLTLACLYGLAVALILVGLAVVGSTQRTEALPSVSRDEAVRRLARGSDLPAEVVMGNAVNTTNAA